MIHMQKDRLMHMCGIEKDHFCLDIKTGPNSGSADWIPGARRINVRNTHWGVRNLPIRMETWGAILHLVWWVAVGMPGRNLGCGAFRFHHARTPSVRT